MAATPTHNNSHKKMMSDQPSHPPSLATKQQPNSLNNNNTMDQDEQLEPTKEPPLTVQK
jgi:hypothetical protein